MARRKLNEKSCRHIISFFRFALPDICLLLLLMLYSVLGAMLFQHIEGNEVDKPVTSGIQKAKVSITNAIVSSDQKSNENAFAQLVESQLQLFEKKVRADVASEESPQDPDAWSFWGSMLYCATVYSTIGYGHIAPSTSAGRIATIFYALVGIPLCLAVLADFGRVLTRILKFLWSFVRRVYYTGNCQRMAGSNIESRLTQDSNEDFDSDDETDLQNVYIVDDEFNLPPIIAIIITVAYMLFGSVMYMQWENWDYLEAFYFIFVSFSTIGFGDVLPYHPKMFMASFPYLLFGLALVAMLITVIMEVVTTTIDKAKARVRRVGKKIGINMADEDEQSTVFEEPVVAKKAN